MSIAIDENDSRFVLLLNKGPSLLQCMDHIPLVSTVSGVARVAFGLIQTCVGVVAFPFQVALRVSNHVRPFILINGFANIIRGSIAIVPIGGNIILYLYDHR